MSNLKKAFTLAEVFIAMVILSVLVSVSVAFFTSKKDYEREYMYYSAYLNLTKVIDSALMNEKYLKDAATPYVEETTCGTTAAPYKCRAFKSTSGTLCKVLSEYFNTTGTVNCSTATTTANPSFKLSNGMEFTFRALGVSSNSGKLARTPGAESLEQAETDYYNFLVDINGKGKGEDLTNYECFVFFVTRSGKVLPDYGQVSGLRGYEYTPAGMDAAGNTSLMAFDVVQTATNSNRLEIVSDLRSRSFVEAACKSGYISDDTQYCTSAQYIAADGSTASGFTKDANCTDTNPCEIRLVKKLRRVK